MEGAGGQDLFLLEGRETRNLNFRKWMSAYMDTWLDGKRLYGVGSIGMLFVVWCTGWRLWYWRLWYMRTRILVTIWISSFFGRGRCGSVGREGRFKDEVM